MKQYSIFRKFRNRDEMLDALAEKRGKQRQQETKSALKPIKAT